MSRGCAVADMTLTRITLIIGGFTGIKFELADIISTFMKRGPIMATFCVRTPLNCRYKRVSWIILKLLYVMVDACSEWLLAIG